MATAIIFGGHGQTGHYLAQLLAARGDTVVQTSRGSPDWPVDISNFDAVLALVENVRPDLIFQLAASSTTRHEALFENHFAIATGTLNVLEAAFRLTPGARVFITGSGVQFLNRGEPIDENTPFEPSSPYSLARIHSVYAARYYRRKGLATYVGYLFHHESPLRPLRHVSQKVAQAARAIASGRQDVLELGDLRVSKEWTFAGDVAAAIATLMEQKEIHEAVLGSGQAHTIQEWVEACFREVNLDWQKHVRQLPGFQPEYERLVSNPARIFALGWRPRVTLPQLARLMTESVPPPQT